MVGKANEIGHSCIQVKTLIEAQISRKKTTKQTKQIFIFSTKYRCEDLLLEKA